MASKSKRPSFDTVMAFMSSDTQDSVASSEIALLSLDVLLPDPGQPRRLLPDQPDLGAAAIRPGCRAP